MEASLLVLASGFAAAAESLRRIVVGLGATISSGTGLGPSLLPETSERLDESFPSSSSWLSSDSSSSCSTSNICFLSASISASRAIVVESRTGSIVGRTK